MDESLTSETLDFETQTDILTLLENVKCQGNNPSGLKQALLALANICSSNSASQEYFHLTGGVEALQALLLEGCCPLSAVPAALYCLACAVRQNVTSQKTVLTEQIFNLIHELLSHSNSSDRLLQSAAFLLACSVAGNNKGQLLANESGCLQDLVNLLRGFMASGSEDEDTWSSIIRAIGVCVSNPQNAHNQQICCSMLPHTLKFVSTEFQHKCLGHVLTLISSVVANNVPNQNRIRRCGGIEILINFIRHQVHVEITPWSMSLLVNAVSAVNACIADNEECEVQAGTLGLVQILLDLLKIKDLELSQVQVFTLTLAHVLESSNEHCQLVSEGRGYYTLVNYLTDCQDEELFKVIKYILTLCKAQGVHELSGGQPHNDVQEEDYDGGHNHSQRDLTAFLKEGLTALSNQLSSIEKISTGIQWMTNANITSQPLDSFRSSDGIPGNHFYTDQMPPHCTLRDKTGSLNIGEWHRKNSFPLHNSLNNAMECQELEIIKNGSLARDIRKPDSETRQVFQNSFLGNSVPTKHVRIIRPRDGGVEMMKMAGVGSNCRQVQNVGTDTPMKPSHGSSTQTENGYHLTNSYAHVSGARNSTSGDCEHFNCHQGLSTHITSMAGSEISQVHSQEHRNTKQVNQLQTRKEGRPDSRCEKMSNLACLEHQVSYQKHIYQDVDSGNTETSPFSVAGRSRQHTTGDRQLPYKKKNTLCPNVQDCRDCKHASADCSPSHLEIEQQHCVPGDDMQSPAADQQPWKHSRKINAVHTDSEPEYVQKEHNRACYDRSCNRAVYPDLSASSTRNTIAHSTCKFSFSHSPVSHFPDVQVIPETVSSTEQNLEANNFRNDLHEDSCRTTMPQHENQLHLLSQLQKLMSSFFKSLLPQQRKPDNHPRSAAQPSAGQCQNVPEMVGSSSSQCKSILSLCEGDGLRDEDQHQEMSHTCLSSTKQTLTNPASKLTNNSVILQPENDSLPDIQKDDHIQSMSTSSNSKNGSGLRDNPSYYGDGVGERSMKTSASKRIVDESKIFIKPSQPCLLMSRTAVHHKAASNIRLAGTPGTPLSVHTSGKTPAPCQPPCSPALSLFDSQLRSMAYRGTTGACVAVTRKNPFPQKLEDSTIGFESTGTAEATANVGSAWSCESKRDGQTCKSSAALDQLSSASLPTSRSPISTTQENCALHQDNMEPLSTHQSFYNQVNHTQSQCIANTVRHKRKSAACIQKRINKKKKAPAECGPQYSKSSLCPGCGTGLNLNSCTYNIAIEASPYTCAYHRHVRQCERTFINQLPVDKRTLSVPKKRPEDKMATRATTTNDVYEFQSGSDEPTQVPPVRRSATSKQNNEKMGRRPRVSYTEQEVLNLLEGVHQMGKHWQQILWTYQFHPSRRAVDLKDKYKQLQTKQAEQSTVHLPFSLCEIRRLKNGVKHLGYNWRAILRSYKFLPSRTAADLHSEWRSLNRVGSFSDDVHS